MANPKAIGETTEAVILAHLIQRGDSVSLPFGNNQRYDMIVDRRGKLIKAQCKTGRLRNGVVVFKVSSYNGFTGEHRDYKGEVDVFLIWCPELNTMYEVPCGCLREAANVFAYRADEERPGGLRALRSQLSGARRRSRTCVVAL